MGDVKPWSMGENPCVSTLFEFPSSLVNLFIVFVEVVGAVMVIIIIEHKALDL